MSRPKPFGRSYGRLTRHERNTVERMLDLNRSAREIAAELGRSPSTVTREVAAHRYVTAPRSRYGEPAPADLSGACPRLSAWPRCCNGCSHRRGYGCSRRPKVFYGARRAQEAADAELSGSRSGIDETEEGAAAKLAAIRDGLARGLSPQQIAAATPGLSASTVYRWVDAGYDGMTNMELRRKVGYRPRSRRAPGRATSHSARRSHASFLALGEDACAAAWEMDTVEGARGDSARLLTLLHRAASSWRCRCRTARAPRSWRRSPPCAGSSARTARGAPSAPCSPTTGASSPTRAPSRRCSASGTARPGSSTATPGRASRRARARRTTSRSGC